MSRLPCIVLTLLCLALPAGAQDSDEDSRNYPEGIAALVEGEPITRHELELACQLRSDFRQPVGADRRKAILAHELEEMIKQRVLLKKVQDEKIEFTKNDEARLQWELSRRARDRRGIDGLKEDLASIGVPYEYFVQRQKTNILVGKLLVKTISRDIFITPAEIRRFYSAHPERFATKGEIRLRQIVLYPDTSRAYRPEPPGLTKELEDWDAKATAEALRKRIQDGESIRKVAEQTSMGVHYKKDERYDTDTRLRDVLVAPLDTIVEELEVGRISEVIESSRGSIHLLVVLARRPPGLLPLSDVQREIESELKEKVWRQRLDTWIAEERAKAHVVHFLN